MDELAPQDAYLTSAANPHRCWRCEYYSFKTFAGEDDTTGKCFRDYEKTRHIYYVNGIMTCPGFREDTEGTYDPRRH